MKKTFQGILTALVTPFNAQGEIDLQAVKKLVRYLIGKGTDGFYVAGSTGEAFLLTTDERKALLEAVAEENNGEKLIIAHVGAISSAVAVELGRHAEQCGVDAISAVPPFYYKFSEKEIEGYYQGLMDRVDRPLFLYNIPSMSGVSLSVKTLDTLAANQRLAGIKFTSNNFFDLERMKHSHPELTVWNGFDEMLLSGLAAGADGAIGSTYNILTPIARGVYDAFRAGDLEKARQYQSMINEMLTISIRHFNLKVIKKVLELEGIPAGDCRAPFTPLTETDMPDVRLIWEKFVVRANEALN